jgi:hypothetical protein
VDAKYNKYNAIAGAARRIPAVAEFVLAGVTMTAGVKCHSRAHFTPPAIASTCRAKQADELTVMTITATSVMMYLRTRSTAMTVGADTNSSC